MVVKNDKNIQGTIDKRWAGPYQAEHYQGQGGIQDS